MCFKCGEIHNSKESKKSKEIPAKCALYGGNHIANYKGCEHYRNLIKGTNKFRNKTRRTPPVNTNIYIYIYRHKIQHCANSQQRRYADVTKSKTNQVENTAIILTKIFTLIVRIV
jgi:hypothetical protein